MGEASNISVAIIDRDESVCRSMVRLLKAAGIGSMPFFSAEKFLAHPDNAEFDCLLLDTQLDGMSGLELHEILVSRGILTPTLFITAHDGFETGIQVGNSGCVGIIRKFAAGSDVLATIRQVVGQPMTSTHKP